ncbi:MAG: hypothetical protein RLZZ385_1000 [Pseudomonadota bacterium]|jgi:gluconolactonase
MHICRALLMLVLTAVSLPVMAQSAPLIREGATLQRVGGEFAFLEGPVGDAQGNLYFTDIDNNRIHRMSADGEIAVLREPSNYANGLTLMNDGSLVICEQAAQRVSLLDADGNYSVLADSFAGRPLNSPNDAWVDPSGGIYFTDPRYSYPEGELSQDGEHVYYINPERSGIQRVVSSLRKPNGIVGTEDGRTVYIADTALRKVFQFDRGEDGTLSNQREFADQGSDGMTMDERGNVYLTWVGGVSVRDPAGEQIAFIETPQMPANVGFGGVDGRTLYMTARTGLYSIAMQVTASRPLPRR